MSFFFSIMPNAPEPCCSSCESALSAAMCVKMTAIYFSGGTEVFPFHLSTLQRETLYFFSNYIYLTAIITGSFSR